MLEKPALLENAGGCVTETTSKHDLTHTNISEYRSNHLCWQEGFHRTWISHGITINLPLTINSIFYLHSTHVCIY